MYVTAAERETQRTVQPLHLQIGIMYDAEILRLASGGSQVQNMSPLCCVARAT